MEFQVHLQILDQLISKIKPSPQQKAELREFCSKLLEIARAKISQLGSPAQPMLLGSAARDTWLRDDKDVDLFLGFPPDIPRDQMLNQGLELAQEIAQELGCSFEKRYAEHPYLRLYVQGYQLDIVPCYKLRSPAELGTAVDRTPFHNQYLESRIKGLEDQVLILKQFLKGLGIYGSELKLQGFSGYLCELLILKYGSFLDLIRSAAGWRYGEYIDLESRGRYRGRDPLILIDPVDPDRNVAAAVSEESLAKFIDASRDFLENPRLEAFFPRPEPKLDLDAILDLIQRRGTKLILVEFQLDQDLVDDIVFPQLRKAQRIIQDLINRYGFRLLRSSVGRNGNLAHILLEMEVWMLPRVEIRRGPPIFLAHHCSKFKSKHPRTFIQGSRLMAEVHRRYPECIQMLEAELGKFDLGKHLSKSKMRILQDPQMVFESNPELVREFFRDGLTDFE